MRQPILHINKPQPALVVEKLYSKVTWRIPQDEKTVYLTFDDGPVPIYTPWVLDILDFYAIKATFFCVGDNVRKHEDILENIIDRGHTIGSHTFNHINGWYTTNK